MLEAYNISLWVYGIPCVLKEGSNDLSIAILHPYPTHYAATEKKNTVKVIEGRQCDVSCGKGLGVMGHESSGFHPKGAKHHT